MATPVEFSYTKVQLVQLLWLSLNTFFVKNFIAATTSKVLIALSLIVTQYASISGAVGGITEKWSLSTSTINYLYCFIANFPKRSSLLQRFTIADKLKIAFLQSITAVLIYRRETFQ
jgi:phage shock protein PspC (stress-responsive transcriptional regulator)